jgi:hypothetical protein
VSVALRKGITFTGRHFTPEDVELIQEVVDMCSGLSRTELARTLCDLLEWYRPNGETKVWECKDLLEKLDEKGVVQLPQLRTSKPRGTTTRVPVTERGDEKPPIEGTVRDFAPISLELVADEDQRLHWRELVGRHHYIGHKVPFGAHLRYLVWIARPEPAVVACLQYTSPAWKMAPRDQWIGWDERSRKRNLQKIVNNSRFLILPWVRIRNLASAVLALAARELPEDWERRYGICPVLLETVVDGEQYSGTCYRAANWVHVGKTSGRGRIDQEKIRYGVARKEIYLFPLRRDFRDRLRA